MALSLTLDVTEKFNEVGYYVADASNWDYIVWQIITGDDTVTPIIFKSTNDSGAVTGVTDGNSLSATNFYTANVYDVFNNSFVTNAGVSGMYRSSYIGQFVRVDSENVDSKLNKLIVQFHKIS